MKIGVLPCQGACNVGVMTNKLALKLVNNDTINMVCPLGLPLGIKSIIDMGSVNDKHIAVNGCPVKCATKALASAGFPIYDEITLTQDFGIQKNKNFADETNMDQAELKLREIIEKLLNVEQG